MSDTPAPSPTAPVPPAPGASAAPPAHNTALRLSEELRKLLPDDPAKPVTISDILVELQERSVAIMLILFAVPFLQPLPMMGLSTLFGFVLGLLGVSMALGRELWFPKWVMNRQVPYSVLRILVEKGGWAAGKVEHLLKARLLGLTTHGLVTRVHGVGIMVMAFLLSLPMPPFPPFTNTAPALAMLLMGLALLEKDGVFVIASYVVQVITTAYFIFIFWTAYTAGRLGLTYFFPSMASPIVKAYTTGYAAGTSVW